LFRSFLEEFIEWISQWIERNKQMNMLNGKKWMSSRHFWKVLLLSGCFILWFSVNALSVWPEFPLSSDCFSGSAYGTQTIPSIAFDGTNFLVVWEDERVNSERDIFGTRVSQQGEILEPIGIPICTAPSLQTDVKIAWGNQNYLAVWTDYRNTNYDIYGARIDPEGNVLDPNGFPISTGSGWESFPDVAWDGTNFFVVWSDDKNDISYDIYGTRITSSGEILDPRGIQISFGPAMELFPTIAFNGTTYLVVWEHGSG
jgi:hypothetical protein